MMNNDANHFAVNETNTAAGPEDLGSDFDLAGAAERAAGTGCVFGGSDQGAASTQFPPPWPGLGMNPLGTDPTVPPLPEEEGERAAEPEDLSTELLRKMLAGSRERDISRVKLAKMPAPTGFRGLPPAKKTSSRSGSGFGPT